MDRITVTFPSPLLRRLRKYAYKEDLSVSSAVVKLIELGLVIDSKSDDPSEEESDINQIKDELLTKITIQTNEIIKEIATKNLDFKQDKIEEIRRNTNKIYDEKFRWSCFF